MLSRRTTLPCWPSQATCPSAGGMRPARTMKWDRLPFRHPYFSYEYTFVRAEQGERSPYLRLCGKRHPHGRERGSLPALRQTPPGIPAETTVQLLDALKKLSVSRAKNASVVTFFNPMHHPGHSSARRGMNTTTCPALPPTCSLLQERMLAHGLHRNHPGNWLRCTEL